MTVKRLANNLQLGERLVGFVKNSRGSLAPEHGIIDTKLKMGCCGSRGYSGRGTRRTNGASGGIFDGAKFRFHDLSSGRMDRGSVQHTRAGPIWRKESKVSPRRRRSPGVCREY